MGGHRGAGLRAVARTHLAGAVSNMCGQTIRRPPMPEVRRTDIDTALEAPVAVPNRTRLAARGGGHRSCTACGRFERQPSRACERLESPDRSALRYGSCRRNAIRGDEHDDYQRTLQLSPPASECWPQRPALLCQSSRTHNARHPRKTIVGATSMSKVARLHRCQYARLWRRSPQWRANRCIALHHAGLGEGSTSCMSSSITRRWTRSPAPLRSIGLFAEPQRCSSTRSRPAR
jgi:hypothetical protein